MPKSSREILIEFNQRAGRGFESCCLFKLKTGQICCRRIEEMDRDSCVYGFYEEGQETERTVSWKHISDNHEEEYRFNAPIQDIDLTNLFFWNTTTCVWMRSFWQSDEQVWIDTEAQHGDIPMPKWRQELESQGAQQEWAIPKSVGWWQSKDEPFYPHPKFLVDPEWRKDDRDRIVAYLNGGHFDGGQYGYSYCRFGCFHEENLELSRKLTRSEDTSSLPCSESLWTSTKMGSSVKTDGVWIWPEGLSHYVENHDVRLPDEFVLTMEQKSWSPDPLVRVPPSIPEDTAYCWVTWALDLIISKKQGGLIA